ncbi:MAG: 3-deoxy-7-phosphoheptulonate synthase [Planctomycetota bacterium]|jgi:3-deoxy-7-phosphoheptulonate synthase
MIIVMRPKSSMKEISSVLKKIEEDGFKPHVSKGEETTIIGVIGDERKLEESHFVTLPGVEKVIPVLKPFKLASRDFKAKGSVIKVNGTSIGPDTFTIMAGPCAVEELDMMLETARAVKKGGARILRGGAFKPRTSPYSFQGLGKKGLEILKAAKEETGLAIVTEVMSIETLPLILEYADILQIGARNMQNFNLLNEVGNTDKPVLLKRGMSATMEEFLLSAEYILSRGNQNVILCERGIRTFEKYTRNTLDIATIPVVKKLSHLPIIIDPSHASGVRDYVGALAKAGLAAGADGMIIEVHPHPEKALSDGQQSLLPQEFEELVADLRRLAEVVGKSIP